jgi:hypothetical protein
MAVPDNVYFAAVETAMSDPDLQAALEGLSLGATDVKDLLVSLAEDAREEIERDAAEQFAELAAAENEATDAERSIRDLAIAENPQDAADHARLVEQIEEFKAEIDRRSREEQEKWRAIESFRSETNVLRARRDAGMLRPGDLEEEVAPPRVLRMVRRLRGGSDPIEKREYEYQLALEGLQNDKKAIADLVTAKMRLESSLDNLERRMISRAASDRAGSTTIDSARIRAEAAQARAERALVEGGLRPLFRRWINDRTKQHSEDRYGLDLAGATASGLAELPDPEHSIDTGAQQRLREMLRSLPGGSIGISGPRGAGKTTLLRSFCDPQRHRDEEDPGGITVLIPAPVRFAPLDFVLHIFEQVCLAVLPSGIPIDPLRREGEDGDLAVGRVVRAATVAAASAVGVALVLGGGLTIRGIHRSPAVDATAELRLLAAGMVVVAAATAMLAMRWVSAPLRVGLAVTVSAIGGAAIIATSSSEAWSMTEVTVVGVAAMGGAVIGSRLLGGSAPDRTIARGGALLVFAGAIAVVISSAADRQVSDAFSVGALMLAVAGLTLALLAWPAGLAFGPWEARDVSGGRMTHGALARRLLRVAGYQAGRGIAVMIATVGIELMIIGWDDAAPSSDVVIGVLLLGGALVLGLALSAGRVVIGDVERRWRANIREETRRARTFKSPDEAGADGPEQRPLEELERLAQERVRQIRYVRGSTSDWSMKVGMSGVPHVPLTAEASTSAGQSATEHPMTLPAAIAALRGYLKDAAEIGGRVVIGIDELDKIAASDEAEQFLNEIKAIFGIRGCYFLISVSEDAVASFELRGMPFRDVLDSTFDDVIRLDHFTLSTTETMLAGRTLHMPVPFMALCHALAGGLPRDVIRVARRLFELRDQAGSGRISQLCDRLLASELKAKRDGTATAIGRLRNQADAAAMLSWLGESQEPDPTTAALLAAWPPWPAPAPDEAGRAVERLAREYGAYWYLSATLLEFFTDDRPLQDFERCLASDGAHSIEALAAARQGFAVEPQIVWDRVSAFRRAWSMMPHALQPFARAEST